MTDLSYVVIGKDIETSVLLMTYGNENAEVKLRNERKRKPEQSCFSVKLEKNKAELQPGDYAWLRVYFNPKKEFFKDRRTEITYKCYLQVNRFFVNSKDKFFI